MFALYCLLFVACVWLMIKLRKFFDLRKIYNELPGDKDHHIIFGDLHKFPGFNEAGLKWFFDYSNKYKYFHRHYFTHFLVIIESYHPEPIGEIIKATSSKPSNIGVLSSFYDMGVPWLGDGLILANGERWHRARRLLTPAFHFDILKKYIKVYTSCAALLKNKIMDMSSNGKSFDIQPLVNNYTLDVILRCAFSYKSDCQIIEGGTEYSKAILEVLQRWSDRILHPATFIEFIYKLTPGGRRFYKLCDIIHRETEAVMKKRHEEIMEHPDVLSSRKRRNFLDILLTAKDENGHGLSWQEIREECDTFMFAGHDTVSSAIMWTLVSLSQHPKYQDLVYNEVKSALLDKDEVEWEDLSKLQFTTQCIKEALRLHTPVSVIHRFATEDMLLMGCKVPKGTIFGINLWMLHHNPHVWDDPLEFQPERFNPDKVVNMHPLQFLPFSAGSRNCIGQNFAMNEMKVTIAEIVRHFHLRDDPELPSEHALRITMHAEKGAYIYASPRNN